MSRLKSTRPTNPHRRSSQKGVRFSQTELAHIRAQADRYCKGNVAEFVRYAALNFTPRKHDLEGR